MFHTSLSLLGSQWQTPGIKGRICPINPRFLNFYLCCLLLCFFCCFVFLQKKQFHYLPCNVILTLNREAFGNSENQRILSAGDHNINQITIFVMI